MAYNFNINAKGKLPKDLSVISGTVCVPVKTLDESAYEFSL